MHVCERVQTKPNARVTTTDAMHVYVEAVATNACTRVDAVFGVCLHVCHDGQNDQRTKLLHPTHHSQTWWPAHTTRRVRERSGGLLYAEAAGKHRLADERDGGALLERRNRRPLARALLPGLVQDLLDQRRTVGVLVRKDVGRDLNQERV